MIIFTKALNKLKSDIRQYWIGITLIVVVFTVLQLAFGSVCPMVIISGLPCPGCGLTRAVVCLFQLKLEESLNYNPTAILWIIFIVWFFSDRYVREKAKTNTKIVIFAMLLTITIIVYVIRMIYYLKIGQLPNYYI